MAYFFEPITCKQCGKSFVPAPQHVYKNQNGAFVCSYHCANESYKQKQQKKLERQERERQRIQAYAERQNARRRAERASKKTERHHDSKKKAVSVYTKGGEFIETYESITEASKATGYSTTFISRVCKGENRTSGEITFRFNDSVKSERRIPKKPVLQKTKEGVLVARHASLLEAGKSIGCYYTSVSNCCHNRKSTLKGYVFEFENKDDRSESHAEN